MSIVRRWEAPGYVAEGVDPHMAARLDRAIPGARIVGFTDGGIGAVVRLPDDFPGPVSAWAQGRERSGGLPSVVVGGIVRFSPNIGITIINPAAAVADGSALVEAVRSAAEHLRDPLLVEACSGDRGPLADAGEMTLEEYLARSREIEVAARTEIAARRAKRSAMEDRRRQFGSARPRLVLQMLAADKPYHCAHCGSADELTVDHIVALSKGGSDDLANLQFLCRSCNSRKGAS